MSYAGYAHLRVSAWDAHLNTSIVEIFLFDDYCTFMNDQLKLVCSPFPAAIAALKRKKRCEKQLQQIDGTLSTIEFQREALENANTNTEVLKIMGVAAKALKTAHQNMYVSKSSSHRLIV